MRPLTFEPRAVSEMFAGGGGGGAAPKRLYSRPLPTELLPVTTPDVAAPVSALVTCSGLAEGLAAR